MHRKELHELTASECLRERFDLEAQLAAAASPTGAQLDSIESRALGPGHNGARVDSQEDRRIRLMDLMNLTKHLNGQELQVCRLRYRDLAHSAPYERLRRPADILEGDGEEIIDVHPTDSEGKPCDGYVRVRGAKVMPAKDHEVAAHLAARGACNADGEPMTAGAVKKRAGTAIEKVGTALKWLAFKRMTDGE